MAGVGQVGCLAGWIPSDARRVLELGCGRGFNLEWLARRQPGLELEGIDLVPRHVAETRRRLGGVGTVRVADFEALGGGASDFVFGVEALAYARDRLGLLRRLAQRLPRGGRLGIVDLFGAAGAGRSPELDELAGVLEVAMGTPRLASTEDWRGEAESVGFARLAERDLGAEVARDLRRLERLARLCFALPALARPVASGLPAEWVRCAVAARLLPLSLAAGGHVYRLLVFERV